jgi:hypothetical protein
MKKINFLFLLITILLFTSYSFAISKDSVFIKRIPHQISFEFGYRNSFYQNTYLSNDGTYALIDATTGKALPYLANSATHGVGVLADYGWQLGGLTGKKPAIYLTIPMGYTMLFPDNPASRRVSMLNYGWTIRHDLATMDKKIIPFVGYGLFLNNLSVAGVQGSVSGHQTQFEGGVNFNTTTHLKYFVKLQCSYSSYPRLSYNKSLHFMYADLRVGVRF